MLRFSLICFLLFSFPFVLFSNDTKHQVFQLSDLPPNPLFDQLFNVFHRDHEPFWLNPIFWLSVLLLLIFGTIIGVVIRCICFRLKRARNARNPFVPNNSEDGDESPIDGGVRMNELGGGNLHPLLPDGDVGFRLPRDMQRENPQYPGNF